MLTDCNMNQVNESDIIIINLLKETDKPLPGTFLAGKLGISRVALWKRIQNLELKGYQIQSSRRGYLLTGEDTMLPHEFTPGAPVIFFQETDSTMDQAWKLAQAGAENGTLVTAESQNHGRGQSQRPWVSPTGGLYNTFILRSPLPQTWAGAVVMESAWKMIELLEQSGISGVEFQWPNDLVQGSKKVGGFLVESAGSPEAPRFFTLGMGINIHPLLHPSRETASLAELSSHPPQRRRLSQEMQNHLRTWAQNPDCSPRRWENRLLRKKTPWEAETWRGEVRCFTPAGIAPDGALMDKQNRRILGFGESRIVRKKGELS